MSSNTNNLPYVPQDTRTAPTDFFRGGDISALDATAYEDASPLPTHERSRIVDRSGNSISESQETKATGNGRTILAALDFHRDEHVQNVLKETKSIAKSGDAVILFNVLSSNMDGGDGVVDKMRLRSDQRVGEMNKLAQEFSQGITVFVHLVHGKPESQLLKVAQKHNADLLILGKRKLSGLKKITASSVSNPIIEKAPCSVLIARGTCP